MKTKTAEQIRIRLIEEATQSQLESQLRILHKQISRDATVIFNPLHQKYFSNNTYFNQTDSRVLKEEMLEIAKVAPRLAIFCNIKNILTKSTDQRNLTELLIDTGNIYKDNLGKTEAEFNAAQRFYKYAIDVATTHWFGLSGYFLGMTCHNSYNLYTKPQMYGFDRNLSDKVKAEQQEALLDKRIIAPMEEGERCFNEHNYTKALKYYYKELKKPYSAYSALKSIITIATILQHHSVDKSRENYDTAIFYYRKYIELIEGMQPGAAVDPDEDLNTKRRQFLDSLFSTACQDLYSLYAHPERFSFDVSWRDVTAAAEILKNKSSALKTRIINVLELLIDEGNTLNLSSEVANLLTIVKRSGGLNLSEVPIDRLLKKLPQILERKIITSPDELISLMKLCCKDAQLSSSILIAYKNKKYLPLLNLLIIKGFEITDEARDKYSDIRYLQDNPTIIPVAFTVLNPNVKISGKFPLNHFFPPKSESDLSTLKLLIKSGAVKIDVHDSGFVSFVSRFGNNAQNVHDEHLKDAENTYISSLKSIYKDYSKINPFSVLKRKIGEKYADTSYQDQQLVYEHAIAALQLIESREIFVWDHVTFSKIEEYLKLGCAVIADSAHYSPDIKDSKHALFAFARSLSECFENGTLVCTKGIMSHILEAMNVIGSRVNLNLSSSEVVNLTLNDQKLGEIICDVVNKTNFTEEEQLIWRQNAEFIVDNWPVRVCKVFGKVAYELAKRFQDLKITDYHAGSLSCKEIDVFVANAEHMERITTSYIDQIVGEDISATLGEASRAYDA
jgi:hypothetical protein